MSMTINTNILAINAHRSINGVGISKAKASERLSSGLRINSASDDAAGLAISEKMKAQIRGLKQAERNVEDGISLIQTAESGMNEISEMITRQRELIIQALNDTYTDGDRAKIQMEIDQLTAEIDSMANMTEFNTIPMLNGANAIFYDVNGDIVDTKKFFMDLQPVTNASTFHLVAQNGYGDSASIDYSGSGGNGFKLQITTPLGTVDASYNVWGSSDVSLSSPSAPNNGNPSVWILKDEALGYDLKISRKVDIHTNSNGEQFYDIKTTVENNSSNSVEFDFLSYIDTDYVVNNNKDNYPNYSIDGPQNILSECTVYTNSNIPVVVDLYSSIDDASMRNINVQIQPSSGGGVAADRFVIGNYNNASNFNFAGGGNLSDSAFAFAYDNKSFTNVGQSYEFVTRVGFTNPINNAELGYTSVLPPLYIQSGANSNQGVYIDCYDCRASSLGINPILSHPASAAEASLIKLDNGLNTLSGYRATCGAQQNRLEHTRAALSVSFTNLEDANSRIADADIAKETMWLTKSNVLQQAAVSIMVQANQQPQTVLQLLNA